MAKITDLKCLRVVDSIYSLSDKDLHPFVHPLELNSFKISFGMENTKSGEGRVKVVASTYRSGYGAYTFTFYGVYNHLYDSCRIMCVQVDREFKESVLFSINNQKINGLWLLEEGDAVEGAAATDLVEAASECSYDQHFDIV